MARAQAPTPRSALPRVAAGLAVALLGVAAAHADESADRDATAQCVAVMQTVADALAARVKAGDKTQEPALRTELERAAALVGRSYLDGLHDEAEAKARLKKAQDTQARWSDEQRARLHAQCVQKADAELAAASALERFIVKRVADRRLHRMLDAP
jgi:hypothetical protein